MILEILNIVLKHGNVDMAYTPLLALGTAGIAEGYKFYKAAQQRRQAKEFAGKPRPILDVEIPSAIKENVRMAKNRAGVVGIPGQGAIENKIGGNTASATRSLVETQQGGASAAAGIAALDQQANDAISNVGIKAGEQNLSDLANLYVQNQNLAPYEADKFQKEWDWNQKDPYLQNMAAASALTNASMQNEFSAVSNLSSLVSSFLYGNANNGKKPAQERVAGSNTGGSGSGYPPYATQPMDPNNPNAASSIPGVDAQFPSTDDMNYGVNQNNDAVRQQLVMGLQAKYPGKTPDEINQMLTALGL